MITVWVGSISDTIKVGILVFAFRGTSSNLYLRLLVIYKDISNTIKDHKRRLCGIADHMTNSLLSFIADSLHFPLIFSYACLWFLCVVNVIIARYLLMYKHTAPAPASGVAGASQGVNNNPIATFISNNKMVVLHLAYILLLAFIGIIK